MSSALDGSPEAVDFIQQCLHRKPEDRPTAAELLLHPWITKASTPPLPMIYKSVSHLVSVHAHVARGGDLKAA